MGMDALEFIEAVDEAEAARVAEAAGTKLVYLKQIANGHRRPSVVLAEKLVTASDGRMDFVRLLRAKALHEQAKVAATPTPQPSKSATA